MTRPDISFKLFLALWNRRQNMTTPTIHFRMADWLETCRATNKTRLLLQAFRSSGKSTITGLFAAWLLYHNPDLRILVLAAEHNLARKMVRNVKQVIERHPLTGGLKPDRLDQWGSDRFTVRRGMELRDPSMLGKGISANITGTRADIIICDDVEVPNTCDTADKRAVLRERLGELEYILVPGGTMLYIGTPHSWFSIYSDRPRAEIGEDVPFLDGYERLTIPVLDRQGGSTWPERFTLDEINRMRRRTGPNKFTSQMMLVPVNITDGRLSPDNLVFYDSDLEKDPRLKRLYLGEKRLVSCSAWWDPAFGNTKSGGGGVGGDGSVLAILYTCEDGAYYLHSLTYLHTDPHSEQDEATQQCRAVAQALKQYHVPSVTLEINGIGRFLPAILRKTLRQNRVPAAVCEVSHRRPKHLRILEAFDAVLAARALHVHDSIKQTPFLTEMREWRPGAKQARDDGLDAVAGALSLEPVRIKSAGFSGRQNWAGHHRTHRATTDFEI